MKRLDKNSFFCGADENKYSDENKKMFDAALGDWITYSSAIPTNDIKNHIISKNSGLDVSTLYEKYPGSHNDIVINTAHFLIKFDLVDWAKTQPYGYIFSLVENPTNAEIIAWFNKYRGYGQMSKHYKKLSDNELHDARLDIFLSDGSFPYKNMSDKQILAAVTDLVGLSGNRTKQGIAQVRLITKYQNIPLSKIHVIYKKSWQESATDVRIGQTNGRGGYCKEACFLSWK